MYFEGDPQIKEDLIYQAIKPAQRKLVVVKFAPVKQVPTGNFEIILGNRGAYSHLTSPVMD